MGYYTSSRLLLPAAIFLVLLGTNATQPPYELIDTDSWCMPRDGLIASNVSASEITASSCATFCDAEPLSRSFILRNYSDKGIFQCLCHGGPCLEEMLLVATGADTYRLTDRVETCTLADHFSIRKDRAPFDMMCAPKAVLEDCYSQICAGMPCCSGFAGCSSRTSCEFTALSTVPCVRQCEQNYLDHCDCEGGASCAWISSASQFACQGDCPIPSGADLSSRFISAVDCSQTYVDSGTIPREATCPMACDTNYVFLGSGVVACNVLGELEYDECIPPCTVTLPSGALSSCNDGDVLEHGESCVFDCTTTGMSPSDDGVLFCDGGVFDSDEQCVGDPCTGVMDRLANIPALKEYDLPQSAHDADIYDNRCGKYVGGSAQVFNSGTSCFVECEDLYLPSVPVARNPGILAIACFNGVVDAAATCEPLPCDATSYYVYNMEKLTCEGGTQVDRFGSVLAGDGYVEFNETCALDCLGGYVASGDGDLVCGQTVVGVLEAEYCRRYYPSSEAGCVVEVGAATLGTNTFETGRTNGADECSARCYEAGNCLSFRMTVAPDANGAYECELWDSFCPDISTASDLYSDFSMSQQGSCGVSSLTQTVPGLASHDCGIRSVLTGSVCSHTCKPGWTVRGSGTVSCLDSVLTSDGCDENSCPRPSILNLTSLSCVDSDGGAVEGDPVPPGSICTMTCDTAYDPVGSGQLTCATGSMPEQACESWCDVSQVVVTNAAHPGCKSLTTGGQVMSVEHGDSCSFECPVGFLPEEDGRLDCTLKNVESEQCVSRATKLRTVLGNPSSPYPNTNIETVEATLSVVGVLRVLSNSAILPSGCTSLTYDRSTNVYAAISTANYASAYTREPPTILSCDDAGLPFVDFEVHFQLDSQPCSDSAACASLLDSSDAISPSKNLDQVYSTVVSRFADRMTTTAADINWLDPTTTPTFTVRKAWLVESMQVELSASAVSGGESTFDVANDFHTYVATNMEAPTNIPYEEAYTSSSKQKIDISWASQYYAAEGSSSKIVTDVLSIFADESAEIPIELQLLGVGFVGLDVVYLNDISCTSTTFVSSTMLQCVVPDTVTGHVSVSLNDGTTEGPVVNLMSPRIYATGVSRISTSGGTVIISGDALGNLASDLLRLRVAIGYQMRNDNPNLCPPLSSVFDQENCYVYFSNEVVASASGSGLGAEYPLVRESKTKLKFELNDACEDFVVRFGEYECSTGVTVQSDDGSGDIMVGWVSDTAITCQLSGGEVGVSSLVSVTRANQPGESQVYFSYLGDVKPMTVKEIAALVEQDGEVDVNLDCPANGNVDNTKFEWDNYQDRAALETAVDNYINDPNFCSEEATYQVIPVNTLVPTVTQLINVGASTSYCGSSSSSTAGDEKVMENCESQGSGAEFAIGIIGSYFFSASTGRANIARITIGGESTYYDVKNDTYIECTLPPGVGRSNKVLVVDNGGFTDDTARVRYKPPVINKVTGCSGSGVDGDGVTYTTDCPRDGGSVKLTISGSHFGSYIGQRDFLPNIFMGTKRCENVIYISPITESSVTYERLRCDLPGEGSGIDVFISMFILVKDVFSSPLDVVKYVPCLPGHFYDEEDFSCKNCSAGTYVPSYGAKECLDCAAGRFSSPGATDCTACAKGKYAMNQVSSECKECLPGSYQPSEGKIECIACAEGTHMISNGATICVDCPIGRSQSLPGSPKCALCSDGTFSLTTGKAICDTCDIGAACTEGNRTQCLCHSDTAGAIVCEWPTTAYDCSAPGSTRFDEPCPHSTNCRNSVDAPVPCNTNELCPAGTGYRPRQCFHQQAYSYQYSNNTITRPGASNGNDTGVDFVGEVDFRCACRPGYFSVYGEVSDTYQPQPGVRLELASTYCASLTSRFDTNNDASISLEELTNVFETSWLEGDATAVTLESFVNDLDVRMVQEMTAADSNGDSNVTLSEFCDYYENSLWPSRILLQCFPCPEGAQCENEDDVDIYDMKAAKGYWQSQEMFFNGKETPYYGESLTFRMCQFFETGACNVESSVWSDCVEGNTDTLCSKCVEGGGKFSPLYGMIPATGICQKCKSDGSEIVVAVLLYGGIGVLFIAYKFYFADIVRYVKSKLSRVVNSARGYAEDKAPGIVLANMGLKAAIPGHVLPDAGGGSQSAKMKPSPRHSLEKATDDGVDDTTAGRRRRNARLRRLTSTLQVRTGETSETIAKAPSHGLKLDDDYEADDGGDSDDSVTKERRLGRRPSHGLVLEGLDDEETVDIARKDPVKPRHTLGLSVVTKSDAEDNRTSTTIPTKEEEEEEEEGKNDTTTSTKEAEFDCDDESSDDDQGQGATCVPKRTKEDTARQKKTKLRVTGVENANKNDRDVEELELTDFSNQEKITGNVKSLLVKFKSLIGTAQIVFSLKVSIDIEWPANPFFNMFSFITISPWELPLTSCAWQFSFFEKFWIMMIAPLFLVFVWTPGMYFLWKFLPKERYGEMTIDSIWQMSYLVPFLVYPLNCNFISSMFMCEELEDGVSYLKADYEVVCFDEVHMSNILMATPFLVLYPLGIPLYFGWSIYTSRDSLFDQAGTRDEEGRPCEPQLVTKKKMGFLYVSYKPYAPYFECLELMRKFFFTVVFVFITPTYPLQLMLGIGFCLVFTSFASWLHPFADPVDQLNYLLTDISLLLVIIGGLAVYCIDNSWEDEELRPSISSFLTFATVVPFCTVILTVMLQTGFLNYYVASVRKRYAEWIHGMYGPDEKFWRVVADRSCGLCCRRFIKRRPKIIRPMLPKTVTRPITAMNETLTKIMKSQDRTYLMCKVSKPLRALCEMAYANGKRPWVVQIRPSVVKKLGHSK
eukprot:g3437.t1